MKRVKHIGIVAVSAEGASLCYRTICIEGEKYLGKKYAHPEVSMHTYPFNEYMKYIEKGDWKRVADIMLSSAKKLAKIGADFIICPDNTVHQAFELFIDKSPIPWLHIAEEVAKDASRRGFKHLGILGTKYLIESEVYPSRLEKYNIKYTIPDEDERNKINDIILNELVYGKFLEESRKYLQKIIDEFKDKGCDAVVLGCTELPLIINDEVSSLPILDSTRILAVAALKYSTSDI